ncbi:MAG: transposase family protein [Rhizonema sp. NSF051]|nr:transposase family protein [Rhizonema sp. NSF051]
MQLNSEREVSLTVFNDIDDSRIERNCVHLLTDILIFGILSVMAGAFVLEGHGSCGLSKYEWLQQFLKLPEGNLSNLTSCAWKYGSTLITQY